MPRAPVSWAAVLLSVLMAGCMDAPTPGQAPATADDEGSLPDAAPGAASHPPSPAAPPRVVPAPTWQPGQWWSWSLTGAGMDDLRLITVVAAFTPQGAAEVAVADLDAGMRAQVLHLPPMGVVERAHGLAWPVHEAPARFLDFPLSDGKTWVGELEGAQLTFTAAEEQGPAGQTWFRGTSVWEHSVPGPWWVYDPEAAMFREVALAFGSGEPFAVARLLDHGTGHEGVVHTVTALDKFHGARGGPVGAAPPSQRFDVAAEKVYLVFGCTLGGETGSYRLAFVPPSPREEALECSFENPGAPWTTATQVRWRSSVPGAWTVAFAPLGQGFVEAEVLGVRSAPCSLGTAATGDTEGTEGTEGTGADRQPPPCG